jgi:hypothetical protein
MLCAQPAASLAPGTSIARINSDDSTRHAEAEAKENCNTADEAKREADAEEHRRATVEAGVCIEADLRRAARQRRAARTSELYERERQLSDFAASVHKAAATVARASPMSATLDNAAELRALHRDILTLPGVL